jgi:hypothetical protein
MSVTIARKGAGASEPPAPDKSAAARAGGARSDRSARRNPVAAEAHRQSLAVANSPHDAEDQAFIDSLADENED